MTAAWGPTRAETIRHLPSKRKVIPVPNEVKFTLFVRLVLASLLLGCWLNTRCDPAADLTQVWHEWHPHIVRYELGSLRALLGSW